MRNNYRALIGIHKHTFRPILELCSSTTDMAVCSRNTASSLAFADKSTTSPCSLLAASDGTDLFPNDAAANGFPLFTNCLANFTPHRTLSSHPLHLNVPSVSSGWVPHPQLGNIPDAQSLVTVYVRAAELIAYTNDCSFVPT